MGCVRSTTNPIAALSRTEAITCLTASKDFSPCATATTVPSADLN